MFFQVHVQVLKNQEKVLVGMYHVQKLNHIRVVQFLEKGYFTDGCAWHSLRLTKKQKITNVRVGEGPTVSSQKNHLRHHCIHMYSTKVGGEEEYKALRKTWNVAISPQQKSLRFFSLIHSSLKVDMTNLLLPYRVVSSITSCKSISDTGVDYYLFVVKNAS